MAELQKEGERKTIIKKEREGEGKNRQTERLGEKKVEEEAQTTFPL